MDPADGTNGRTVRVTTHDSTVVRATVVVTTHDRPALARRAIASALAQTLAGIEVVVVDDGSEPAFVAPIDARVRMTRHESAGGVTTARNAGLRAARGEWVTFLDDDDVLVPEMLERSISAAEQSTLPGPVAVMSAVAVRGDDGLVAETLVPPRDLTRGEDFFLERKGAAGRVVNSLVAPTATMRSIGGFDERLEAFEHDDLGLRLNQVASIVGLAEPLYVMSAHVGPRVSQRWRAAAAGMEYTLAKHPEAFARHTRGHARFMGITGYYHLKAGDWLGALRWSSRAVRRDPGDRRSWFYLVTAIAGPHVLRAYQRLRPAAANVSFGTLMRRRARKYAKRIANYPRALVAVPAASLMQVVFRRVGAVSHAEAPESVLLLCIYRAENARFVAPLVEEARTRAWDVRLWALDRIAPSLADVTVGVSGGAKFPLLNRLATGPGNDRFDWIVVADDDVEFKRGSVGALLTVAEAAGLDFVQPAHTELSHRDNEITRRPRLGHRAPHNVRRDRPRVRRATTVVRTGRPVPRGRRHGVGTRARVVGPLGARPSARHHRRRAGAARPPGREGIRKARGARTHERAGAGAWAHEHPRHPPHARDVAGVAGAAVMVGRGASARSVRVAELLEAVADHRPEQVLVLGAEEIGPGADLATVPKLARPGRVPLDVARGGGVAHEVG